MRRRCSNNLSSPLVPVALLLLLTGVFHRAATARLLPPAAAVAPPADQNGAMAAGAADGLVLRSNRAAVGADGLLPVPAASEVMGAEEEEEGAACDDGNDADECLQRRLLGDAHLDYIYTQHKGKP